MISRSSPWKDSLLRDADLVERWADKTAITERRSALLERKIFLAAYVIRKLASVHLISSSFEGRSLNLNRFPPMSAQIDHWTGHRIDKHYALENPERATVAVPKLLNLLIHSLVFAEEYDEAGRVVAFYVTSDDNRYIGLYRLEVSAFATLMRDVGNDYPTTTHMVRDPKTNDWIVWAGYGQPPRHIQEKLARALEGQPMLHGANEPGK